MILSECLVYTKNKINYLGSMRVISLKILCHDSLKFLCIVTLIGFFIGVFSIVSTPSKAQSSQVPYASDANGPIRNRDCGGTIGERDVKCRCPINSCRLSNDSEYSCILGSVNMNYYLGKDTDLLNYTDIDAYKKLFGVEPLKDDRVRQAESIDEQMELYNQYASKTLYIDIFNANGTQAMIPAGSYCKLHPSDPNGVAYWYYPGYFYTLQGRDYLSELQSSGGIGNVAVGAACGGVPGERILFTDTDLFGNKVTGTKTFFGCLPNSPNGITAFLVRLITGLAIFVTLIIAGINLILIIGNPTNPDLIQKSQKRMFAAITTLIGILFTITILNIVGIQIIGFGSDGIGGSIFRFFVGGG